MTYEFRDKTLDSLFILTDHIQRDDFVVSETDAKRLIQFNWNRNPTPVSLLADGIELVLQPDQITTFTYHHKITYPQEGAPIAGLFFNRDFYCIADHDAEIGCNGILFFGTQDLPLIKLDEVHQGKLDLLWQVMIDEFGHADKVQGEMLQMLLKRFIILCTRLAKEQLISQAVDNQQLDIIRKFNVLVDLHFRTLKQVKDYAALLHRSPKTLSNLFARYGDKSPQQLIQERIVLEAKRLFFYTDKQIQEVGFELGFEEPAYFSRFFKKATGHSPNSYRDQMAIRTISQ